MSTNNISKPSKADQLRAKIEILKKEARRQEATERREVKDAADRAHRRRVFQIGEIFVKGALINDDLLAQLTAMVDQVYTTDADRALWGLPPLQSEAVNTEGA